jgi:FkbM family methyltransferase
LYHCPAGIIKKSMGLFTKAVKLAIRFFGRIIMLSKDSTQYLLEEVFRKQLIDFVDHKYYHEYSHIHKSIQIAKTINTEEKGVILDIGGSVGTTAVLYAAAFPSDRIYVFEPIRSSFEKLQQNTRKYSNISVVNKAIGNETGKKTIQLANRISSSSLFNLKGSGHEEGFGNSISYAGTEDIEITTLNKYLTPGISIRIMKIDVQGYEIEVLLGASDHLQNVDLIVVEVSNHDGYESAPKYYEVDRVIRENGFVISDLFPNSKEKNQLLEWDIIYINKRLI